MPPKKTGAAGAKKGKSSAYNKYMKDQLAKLKTEKPSITHKERFKLAATSWASYTRERGNSQFSCALTL
ncbi:hypothetical protein NDA14_002350 [Ustilago hordei]|nr:hypothetical protein NDA14_002350 [Ustilago hordei]